jgi:benzoyl-CoA reductase/2-hydroxyglutaryl-CoA dehydratase subunit BcrC/BadD/HgdB
MKILKKYQLFVLLMSASFAASAQNAATSITLPWSIRDTIIMPVVNYQGEFLPYRELENVYVSKLSPEQLAQILAAYNRLRNAVCVTYPYARTAGSTLNDVAQHLAGISSKSQRKAYIKTREKELKKEFSDPLENLSVYQGKVLMKLINRQTGNNCYDIIKEYRGSFNARMYQTVAFFFGSSLRQDYDHVNDNTDRQIENIVKEIDGVWYNNPSRPMVSNSR